MKKLGLIGRNISYSFSKKYFEEKFQKLMLQDYSYSLYDLQNIEETKSLLQDKNVLGFNVTVPYKIAIIPFLDELSEEADKIGAVNCVSIKNGKSTGYNTDAYGFERSLKLHKKDFQHSALVLGDGGAAKAVKYVLEKLQIPYQTVSRSGNLNFNNLTENIVFENKIIIQCTPVGTFPNVEECLDFPFLALTKEHLVMDLIYNPNYTQFIKKSAAFDAKTSNGFFMLEQQAEKSWEIWNY